MSQVERAKEQNCILPLLASILIEKQVYCDYLTTCSAYQSLPSPSVDYSCYSRPQCHSSLEKEDLKRQCLILSPTDILFYL